MSKYLKRSTSFIFQFYKALKYNICFSCMAKCSTSQVKIMLLMLATQTLCLAFFFFGGGGGGGVCVFLFGREKGESVGGYDSCMF